MVQKALDQGLPPVEILDNGLLVGMNEVSTQFEQEEMFVPEVLLAAKAMHDGLEVLRPHLVASGAKPTGKIVLGTKIQSGPDRCLEVGILECCDRTRVQLITLLARLKHERSCGCTEGRIRENIAFCGRPNLTASQESQAESDERYSLQVH